jgi:hypothetical protein
MIRRPAKPLASFEVSDVRRVPLDQCNLETGTVTIDDQHRATPLEM